MKLADRMSKIQYSPIRKFHSYYVEAVNQGKKVFCFNIGQPDVVTPNVFMESIQNYCDPVLGYTPSQGIPELIKAVQDYYKRYDMDFKDDEIIVTSGGSEAISFIFASILNEGDEVLMAEPFYTNYLVFAGYFNGKVVPIPTKAEDGFHYADQDKIEKLITPRTKAIMVNSPSNPTGNVLTADEMKMILALAKKHDLYVIADEVYREFVYDGEPLTSFGQHMKGYEDNLIIVDSISKRFSACGARIGELLTKNKEILGACMKLAQGRLSTPTLEQKGAVSLYSLDESYFNEVREEYQRRRDVAIEEIDKIEGAVCRKPKGSFYITIKLPIDSAEDFLIFMLTEFEDKGETTMFAPAEGFYATPGMGKNEIRIAYVLNEDEIRRGIQVLNLGLTAYKNKK